MGLYNSTSKKKYNLKISSGVVTSDLKSESVPLCLIRERNKHTIT